MGNIPSHADAIIIGLLRYARKFFNFVFFIVFSRFGATDRATGQHERPTSVSSEGKNEEFPEFSKKEISNPLMFQHNSESFGGTLISLRSRALAVISFPAAGGTG
jgi:hypothetical protein